MTTLHGGGVGGGGGVFRVEFSNSPNIFGQDCRLSIVEQFLKYDI